MFNSNTILHLNRLVRKPIGLQQKIFSILPKSLCFDKIGCFLGEFPNKSNILILLCSFFLFIILHQDAYSAPITLSDAQRLFGSVDRSMNTIKWKCRIERNFRLSDSNDPNSKLPRKKDTFEDYTVLYDLKSKQFLLQGEYCIPWIDGETPTVTKEIGFSYDGKQYICWEKRKKDKVNTQNEVGFASISDNVGQSECDQSFITSSAASAGFGIGFPGKITLNKPNYFSAVSLSELFNDWDSKKLPVILQEDKKGKWTIEGPISWPGDSEMRIRVLCDLSHDGIIDEFIRFSRSNDKDIILQKITIEYIKNSQGKLVPNIVRLIYPLDKLLTEFHYTDVEFMSNVNNQAFQFKIPDGTYVTDHIAKKYYKVGDLVDEDEAISDFITRHGLTGNVPHKPTYGNIVRIVLMTIGGLMILTSIILYIRKRW
jgi:hypothetical protein